MIDILVFLTACPTLGCYVYRMTQLQWRKHRPWVVILHGAWGSACAACIGRAWDGQTGLLEVASVLGAIAWLIVSSYTWKDGVPHQFETRPMELEPEHFTQMNGGRK